MPDITQTRRTGITNLPSLRSQEQNIKTQNSSQRVCGITNLSPIEFVIIGQGAEAILYKEALFRINC